MELQRLSGARVGRTAVTGGEGGESLVQAPVGRGRGGLDWGEIGAAAGATGRPSQSGPAEGAALHGQASR